MLLLFFPLKQQFICYFNTHIFRFVRVMSPPHSQIKNTRTSKWNKSKINLKTKLSVPSSPWVQYSSKDIFSFLLFSTISFSEFFISCFFFYYYFFFLSQFHPYACLLKNITSLLVQFWFLFVLYFSNCYICPLLSSSQAFRPQASTLISLVPQPTTKANSLNCVPVVSTTHQGFQQLYTDYKLKVLSLISFLPFFTWCLYSEWVEGW